MLFEDPLQGRGIQVISWEGGSRAYRMARAGKDACGEAVCLQFLLQAATCIY